MFSRNQINYVGSELILPYAISIDNLLLCDGSEVLIEQYPQLYEEIGVKYGGDGLKTFSLPNYKKSVPELNVYICSKNTKLTTSILKKTLLGEIIVQYVNYTPENFISCKGQVLSIEDNESLYQLLDTQLEDDSTKFKIIDLTSAKQIKKVEYETHYVLSKKGQLVSEIETKVNKSIKEKIVSTVQSLFNTIINNKFDTLLVVLMILLIVYKSSVQDIILHTIAFIIAILVLSKLILGTKIVQRAIRFDYLEKETLVSGLFNHTILAFKIIGLISIAEISYKLLTKGFEFRIVYVYIDDLAVNMPLMLYFILFLSILYQCKRVFNTDVENNTMYEFQQQCKSEPFEEMCGLNPELYDLLLESTTNSMEKEKALSILNTKNKEIENKISEILFNESEDLTVPTYIYKQGLPGNNYFNTREYESFTKVHIKTNQLQFFDYDSKYYDVKRGLIASIPLASVLEIEVRHQNKKSMFFKIVKDSFFSQIMYYITTYIFILGVGKRVIPVGADLVIKYVNYDGIISEAVFDIPIDVYLFKKIPESFKRTKLVLPSDSNKSSMNRKGEHNEDEFSYEYGVFSTIILVITSLFKGNVKAYQMALETKKALDEYCYNAQKNQTLNEVDTNTK